MPTQTDFYEKLAPNISFDRIVSDSAPSQEVIGLIVTTVNDYSKSKFVRLVKQKLSYGNPNTAEFVKRVFDYVCSQVKYLRDPQGHEIIYTPELLIKRGRGDCKKYSTFISSVLKEAGIQSVLKVVAYDKKNDWQHVYVIVPTPKGYITLDPVNDCKYNKEVKHAKSQLFFLDGTKSDIKMNKLSQMGNIPEVKKGINLAASDFLQMNENIGRRVFGGNMSVGCCMGSEEDFEYYISGIDDEVYEEYLSGVGKGKIKAAVKKAVTKTKEAVKKVVQAVVKTGKTVSFAPARASFLGLLLLGKGLQKTPLKINLPAKLVLLWNKDNGKTLGKMWADFGGDPKVLGETILKGSKAGVGGWESINGFDVLTFDETPLNVNLSGIGVITLATASAAIVAALPLIMAANKLLKDSGLLKADEAKAVDSTVAQSTEQYNEEGKPTIPTKGNPIIIKGAEQGDNGHTGADPADATPTQGAVLSFYQPYALNTWVKAVFLFSLFAAYSHNQIAIVGANVSFVILISLSINKLYNLIFKLK